MVASATAALGFGSLHHWFVVNKRYLCDVTRFLAFEFLL